MAENSQETRQAPRKDGLIEWFVVVFVILTTGLLVAQLAQSLIETLSLGAL